MNPVSSDKSSGNGRAATRASYGSNSFERINQSQKHEWEQLLIGHGLLFYIILNLYLIVTSRIADLVPTVPSSRWLTHIKIGTYKSNSRVSKNGVI